MDETGIELEELYANKELEVLTLPYQMLGEISKGILITGVALTEGVWKNVIYSAKEIEKVSKSLIGKPLLVEHGNTKEFGSSSVGEVTKSYYEPSLKGIVFEAVVTDPLAKKLVKRDILPAVSCSTWMEKRAVNEQIRIGSDYNFAELSLVRTPACDRCFIFHKEQLSLWRKEKALSKGERKELTKEEIKMTEEEFVDFESLSEESSEVEKLEAPKLFVVLQLPDEESLENLRHYRHVVSYYYGKPSSYYPYKKHAYYGYGYPYKYKKGLSEEAVLLAVVQLDSKIELNELKETYQVKDAYYADAPMKLSKEDLQNFAADLKRILDEFTQPREKGDEETQAGALMPHQTGAPNPEQCKKVVCPVDDQEFEDEEKFLEHWEKEHKEKYGAFKETMAILAALSSIVDLAKGDTKIVKTRTGRFVVFVDTGKEGFGQWKIIGNFGTRKEADEAAAKAKGGKVKEEKQEEEKDEHGCIIGKEEWSEEEKKCKPVSEEEASAYTDFIAKCMKGGKSMKECAAQWGKEEKSAYTDFMGKCLKEKKDIEDIKARMKACAAEYKKEAPKKEEAPEEKPEEKQEFVCPACKAKFESEKDLAAHWKEKHMEKYGPIKKDYKYPEKKAKAYYYYKYKGKYYPYYYKDKKYYKKYKKPKK